MYSNPSYDPQPLASHDTEGACRRTTRLLSDEPRQARPPACVPRALPAGIDVQDRSPRPVAIDDRRRDTRHASYPTLRAARRSRRPTRALANFGGRPCGGTLARELRRVVQHDVRPARPRARRRVRARHERGSASAPSRRRSTSNPARSSSIGPPPGSFQDNQPQFALAGIGQGDVAHDAAPDGARRRGRSPTAA